MALTKQHFELVANVVREADDLLTDLERTELAERFASEFQCANPLFDLDRFYDACGVEVDHG